MVARLRRRGQKLQRPVALPGHVHEQVERGGDAVGLDAAGGERSSEVLGAAGVAGFGAEQAVALGVAGRDQRVVHAGAGVLDEREQRPAVGAVKTIADPRDEPQQCDPGVRHREVLAWIVRRERPHVHDLAALVVGDTQRLASAEGHRDALTGGKDGAAWSGCRGAHADTTESGTLG